MAIEKVKKVLIATEVSKKESVLETLFNLNIFHLESVRDDILENIENLKPLISNKFYDSELNKIRLSLTTFKEFGLDKQGFIQGFLPQDVEVEESELKEIVESFPLDNFYNNLSSLKNRFNEITQEEAKLLEDKKALMKYAQFPFQFSILLGTSKTKSFICEVKKNAFEKFEKDERANDVFYYAFNNDKNKVNLFVLYHKDDENLIQQLIKDYSFVIQNPPTYFTDYFEEEAQKIEKRLSQIRSEKEIIVSKVTDLYKEKQKLIILEDYYQAVSHKEKSLSKCLKGNNFVIIKGYVKESDYKTLIENISKYTDLIYEVEIEDKDLVPVSLKNSLLFKPFEFLIRLFGMPSYNNIDPTFLVTILFTIFFGFALGDAGYGLLLAIFSFVFLMKYRRNIGAWKFFSILFYGGLMSVVVGILTNSYFGNIFEVYFPNLPLTKFLANLAAINPTSADGSVQFMALSVIIGFTAQMIGILTSFVVKIKNKAYLDGIFNSLGWLFFLPGLVLMFLKSMFPQFSIVATILTYTGLVFILIGGWMSIRTPLFKPIAALVNLYGIRSSYGISGFLGDTLSYLRLFALGLSSGILASSFNLMSKVIGEMLGPIGFLVTVILLLALHSLAFFMNVLGAFIHSMRLNFLEFFGRFYDLGGYEFKPFGFEFKNIRIKNNH